MFILHGTTTQTAELGRVGEYCPLCEQPCQFIVSEIRTVSHVYFLPVGKGTAGPAMKKCTRCSSVSFCDPLAYPLLLPERVARTSTPGELLEQTNPDLAAAVERRARLRRDLQHSGPDGDAAQLLAMCELRDLRTQSRRAIELQDRLLGWHRLPSEGRESLPGEIAAYTRQYREEDRTNLFVANVCGNVPEGAGCMPTILTAIVSGALFIWLGVWLRSETVGSLLLFAWMGTAGYAQYWFMRRTYRRWFTKRLIEPAEAAGLDPSQVAQILKELHKKKPANVPIRSMISRSQLLEDLIQERKEALASV